MPIVLSYPHVNDVLLNMCEVERQITIDIASILGLTLGFTAKPYLKYASSNYPLWLNGMIDEKPDSFGIWENYQPITILTQLQVGKKTEGYEGELEQSLQTWVPYAVAKFNATPRFQTPARPDAPLGLLESQTRQYKWANPGDIMGAQFLTTLHMFVTNPEEDF